MIDLGACDSWNVKLKFKLLAPGHSNWKMQKMFCCLRSFLVSEHSLSATPQRWGFESSILVSSRESTIVHALLDSSLRGCRQEFPGPNYAHSGKSSIDPSVQRALSDVRIKSLQHVCWGLSGQ
eukprot:3296-Amphidinium_carterae.3